jgi:Fe2+ transport system protein FeoA
MYLNDLKPGQRGKVAEIIGPRSIRRRLLDMGIRSGETVALIKSAPFKDPLEISIGNGHLSIRRSEAALIRVEVLNQVESQ